MARKKQEDPPKPAAAWMNTFADLMNLLLCFFVLLFSMSTVDAQKFEQVAASFAQSFSIFTAGASAIGDGILVSNGVSQLNELDQYMNSTGKASDGDIVPETLAEAEAQVEQAKIEDNGKAEKGGRTGRKGGRVYSGRKSGWSDRYRYYFPICTADIAGFLAF